jgi:hypothetical protein
MAVRPPEDDDSGPESIAFGIAALAAKVEESDLEFPATSREVVATLGDVEIPVNSAGNAVSLREALQSVPRDRFESANELLDVLHPVFEEYRSSASTSLVARLRGLLPF